MAQSPINLLLIQFNAIELKDWIDLVDQPYGAAATTLSFNQTKPIHKSINQTFLIELMEVN